MVPEQVFVAPIEVTVDDNEDDNGTEIAWNGPWKPTIDLFLDPSTSGYYGNPYKKTLHALSTNGSVSFNFSGTQVGIWGVNQEPLAATGLSWECFLDGTSIGQYPTLSHHLNQYPMCTAGQLSNGQHTINLVVTIAAGTTPTFFVDYIAYVPSPMDINSAALSGHEVVMSGDYANVKYSPNGAWASNMGHLTQQTGAFVDILFSGTSLIWFGNFPAHTTSKPAPASYSIDGGSETTFQVTNPVPGSDINQYNREVFRTNSLSPGQHTLRVTFQGDSSTVPLSFTGAAIEWQDDIAGGSNVSSVASGAAFSQTGSTPGSHSTSYSGIPPSSTRTNDDDSSQSTVTGVTPPTRKVATGAIVGGTIGGVLFLLVAVFLVLWLRHRRKMRKVRAGARDIRSEGVGTDPAHNGALGSVAPYMWSQREIDTLTSSAPLVLPRSKATPTGQPFHNHSVTPSLSDPPGYDERLSVRT